MKVLIAEDDLTSRALLRRVVGQWGFETVVVADGQEALDLLMGEDPPRLAVLDWMMPGMDGVQICRQVRSAENPNPPYIILLTARADKGDIVTGLEAGANDYVQKPFNREELRARLQVGRRFVELNAKLMQTQAALEKQALTDVLTGVMNRRAILGYLGQEIARAERQGTSIGVGLLDVDHFKAVNDAYGHTVGDAVLQVVAERSIDGLRPYDAFGRFGGEEFLLVLPGAGPFEVQKVLERLHSAIGGSPVECQGRCVTVTVSIGGAARSDESVDELIHAADNALYQAKERGRNQVVMSEACPEASFTQSVVSCAPDIR